MNDIVLLGPPPDDYDVREADRKAFFEVCRQFQADPPTHRPFRHVREILRRGLTDDSDLGPVVD